MIVRRGVTRRVFLTERWAFKVPLVTLDDRWRHQFLRWAVRGWLANRSEWRQRSRPDVAEPVFSFFHFVLVMPRAITTGDAEGFEETDPTKPWFGYELIDDGRKTDEMKPSSWGWFGEERGWLHIDFDRSWEHPRGCVGGIHFWRQECQGRRWAKMSPPALPLSSGDARVDDHHQPG